MLPPALDRTSPYFNGMWLRLGTETLIRQFARILRPLLEEAGVPCDGTMWLTSYETRDVLLADVRSLSCRSDQRTNLWNVDAGPVPDTLPAGLNLLARGFAEGFHRGRVSVSTLSGLQEYWFDNDDGAHRIGAGRAVVLRYRPNHVIGAEVRSYHASPELLAVLELCEIVVAQIPADAQFRPHATWVNNFLRCGPVACALEWFGEGEAREPVIALLWRRSDDPGRANGTAVAGRGFHRLADMIGIAASSA